MKNNESMNNILFYDAYLEFLERVSALLSRFHLRACCWDHGRVCLYHSGSGSRFWVAIEELAYINEETDEWLEDYLPGGLYWVHVKEDGHVIDQ